MSSDTNEHAQVSLPVSPIEQAPIVEIPASALPNVPPMKTCVRCQKQSPLADYPENAVTEDGHDSICLRCLKWKETSVKAACKKIGKYKLKGRQPKTDEPVIVAPVKIEDEFKPVEDEVGEEDMSADEVDGSAPEKEVVSTARSGFSKNLGDGEEQSVYTKGMEMYEVGGVVGDLAGRKPLTNEQDELFCTEWVASGGEGGKAYRKAYRASEGGKKLEKLVEVAIKRFDVCCRIRYLRDEKAVAECGFDIAQGKGRWMEAVCKLAMEASTARDKLKALELISKAMGHDKMKATSSGGTVIRITTGVRGEPGRNQMKDKKEAKE